MHVYYALRRDGRPLLPVSRGVFADGKELEGFVACYSDVDALLAAGGMVLAASGFPEEPTAHVVRFEADPAETRAPSDRNELVARPIAELQRTPLRDFLEQVMRGGSGAQAEVAGRRLNMIAAGLADLDRGPDEDPEQEFTRGPYDPDPELIDVFIVAPPDEDLLARTEGPYVDGRDLPAGYREAFFAPEDVLMSRALEVAANAQAVGDAMHVVTVNVEDDMICFPEELDPDEPKLIYVRVIEVEGSTPVADWIEAQEPERDEPRERREMLKVVLG